MGVQYVSDMSVAGVDQCYIFNNHLIWWYFKYFWKATQEGTNHGIADNNEVLTVLRFLHDLGTIIYFGSEENEQADGESLGSLVILDPQWLIDIFKRVITVKPNEDQVSWLVASLEINVITFCFGTGWDCRSLVDVLPYTMFMPQFKSQRSKFVEHGTSVFIHHCNINLIKVLLTTFWRACFFESRATKSVSFPNGRYFVSSFCKTSIDFRVREWHFGIKTVRRNKPTESKLLNELWNKKKLSGEK